LLGDADTALRYAAAFFIDGDYSASQSYSSKANRYRAQAAELDAPRGEALRAVVEAIGSPSALVRRKAAEHLLSLARGVEQAAEWNTFADLGVLSVLRDRVGREDDAEAKAKERQAADYIAEHVPKPE
jgi:hypothetical protein